MKTHANTASALALTLTLAMATGAWAQPDLRTQPIEAMGMVSTIEGRVVAVNPETRLMTLRTPDDKFEVLRVPPEVSRLDRVRIGNQVQVTEVTTALIEVQRGRDAGAMGIQSSGSADRAPGSLPAGTLRSTIRLYGQIVGVDSAAGTVQIKGARDTHTFEITDKGLLGQLKVGDGVIATIRETLTGEITMR
ncbi:hypothetical protein [Thiohalocapsa sp. ML1]|jgi:hypothetical protein|uniref:hypothetical protein n=1 Tax=Thiohalocapsa sp. ML1 TaxID=1431688 RepID=UPI00073224BA|nr:hypothetical protein [Thiohalocapsa sp. ML1]